MGFLSKNSLEDFTEFEFVAFLRELFREDESGTDERADKLLLHFRGVVGHPSGSDLIYCAESDADCTPEELHR